MLVSENHKPVIAFSPLWLLVLAGAALFYIAMRWHGMAEYCLDGDELFSLLVARHGLGGLLNTAAADISHPPLFYLLLKVWIGIGGQSLVWLRLFPVLISVATLVPVYLLCRKLRLCPWETSLVVAMLGANGFLIQYSQHLRMFVLLEFFSAWSVWALVRLIATPTTARRDWCVLFLINLGLVYSHYWGWVLLGTEFVVLLALAREKVPAAFLIGVALVISYVPWAYAVLKCVAAKGAATSQISWLEKPGILDMVWFFEKLNGTFEVRRSGGIGLLLFGVPVLLFALRTNWRIPYREFTDASLFLSMFALAVIPVVATYFVSIMLPQSVWAERELVIVALPYMILVVVAAFRFTRSRLKIIVPLLMLVWSVSSGIAVKSGPAGKIAWDSLVRSIRESEDDSAKPLTVYALEGFVARPLDFYANDGGTKWLDVRIEPSFEHLDGRHFWIAFRDTKWKDNAPPQAILAKMGFRVGDSITVGTTSQKVTIFPVSKGK